MTDLKRDFESENGRLINFINLTDEEKEIVRNWRNKESVKKWMHSRRIISRKEHGGFIDKLKNDDKNYYWLLKDSLNKYIGVIYLSRMDVINKCAYLGIYKNPDRGFMGSGKILMDWLKEIAFKEAGLQSLKLEVMNDNDIAIRFFKESGFKEERRGCSFTVMSFGKGEKIAP